MTEQDYHNLKAGNYITPLRTTIIHMEEVPDIEVKADAPVWIVEKNMTFLRAFVTDKHGRRQVILHRVAVVNGFKVLQPAQKS